MKMVGMPELHSDQTAVTGTLKNTTTTVDNVTTTSSTIMSCMEELAQKKNGKDDDDNLILAFTAFFVVAELAFEIVRGLISISGPIEGTSARGYLQGHMGIGEDWIGVGLHVITIIFLFFSYSNICATGADSQCTNNSEKAWYIAAIIVQILATISQLLPWLTNRSGLGLNEDDKGTKFTKNMLNTAIRNTWAFWQALARFCTGLITTVVAMIVLFASFEDGDVCTHDSAGRVYFFYGLVTLLYGLITLGIGLFYVKTNRRKWGAPKIALLSAGALYVFIAFKEWQVGDLDHCPQLKNPDTLHVLPVLSIGAWFTLYVIDSLMTVGEVNQGLTSNAMQEGGLLRPRGTDMAMTRLTTDKGAANDAKSLQFV